MHSSLSSMSESKHAFVFVFCFILSYFFCIFSINQLWDMKQPNQCYNHFQAHSNSVFTLNWHPEDKYCLATGGRDYFIKVWDTCVKGQLVHTIQTISAVHRLKWRPNHKYHVARLELVYTSPAP